MEDVVGGTPTRRSRGGSNRRASGADGPLAADDCADHHEASSSGSTTTDTTLGARAPGSVASKQAERSADTPPTPRSDVQEYPSSSSTPLHPRTSASVMHTVRGSILGLAAMLPTMTADDGEVVQGSIGDGPDSAGGGSSGSRLPTQQNPGSGSWDSPSHGRRESNSRESEPRAGRRESNSRESEPRAGYPRQEDRADDSSNNRRYAAESRNGESRRTHPSRESQDLQDENDFSAPPSSDELNRGSSEGGSPPPFRSNNPRGTMQDRAAAAARQFADSFASAAATVGSIDVRKSLVTLDGAFDGALGLLGSSGAASSSTAPAPKARRQRRRSSTDSHGAIASGEECDDDQGSGSDASETWSPEGVALRPSVDEEADDAPAVRSMAAQNAAIATTEDFEGGPPASQPRRKEGRGAVVASEANIAVSGTAMTLDALVEEARTPFGQLLVETPDAATLLEGHGAGASEEIRGDEARSPLFSMLVRDWLIGHVIGCCDAVANDLSKQEAKLWNAFVAQDLALQGTIAVREEDLRGALGGMASSQETLDYWINSLFERADGDTEIDFADLLDWFMHEREEADEWTLQSTLRTGLSQLFSSAAASSDSTPPRLLQDNVIDLRDRCMRADPMRLAEAAAAYQRSMVLTSCWRCEQHLRRILTPVMQSARNADGIHGRPPGPAAALLAVLRSIHAELAPSERVLWELLGSKDGNFDGALLQSEVLEAIAELYQYALGPESDATQSEFEELQRLRADCQRQSVEGLFQDGSNVKRSVNLADVLKWWWDMPEEYRIAAGLAVPAGLLRRGLRRQPEEMFKTPLRRVAADPSLIRFSLRGNVRVFAELRALCVRRALEGIQTMPTDTRTTNTSEADLTSIADDTENDGEEDALDEHETDDTRR